MMRFVLVRRERAAYLVTSELQQDFYQTRQLIARTASVADKDVDLFAQNSHFDIVDMFAI